MSRFPVHVPAVPPHRPAWFARPGVQRKLFPRSPAVGYPYPLVYAMPGAGAFRGRMTDLPVPVPWKPTRAATKCLDIPEAFDCPSGYDDVGVRVDVACAVKTPGGGPSPVVVRYEKGAPMPPIPYATMGWKGPPATAGFGQSPEDIADAEKKQKKALGCASSAWMYGAIGLGALVVGQFFWWNAKAPGVLKLGK